MRFRAALANRRRSALTERIRSVALLELLKLK